MTMKNIYIKPSIVVEENVLTAVMQENLSTDSLDYGGGNGGTGDGENPTEVSSKFMYYDGFGRFGTFDDDDY